MIAKVKKSSIKAPPKKKSAAKPVKAAKTTTKETPKETKKEAPKSSLHRMLTAEGWKRMVSKG